MDIKRGKTYLENIHPEYSYTRIKAYKTEKGFTALYKKESNDNGESLGYTLLINWQEYYAEFDYYAPIHAIEDLNTIVKFASAVKVED